MPTIVWFRDDLRIADNPALHHAASRGTVIPVYIVDEGGKRRSPPRALGGASRWWLHLSLTALSEDLGGLLILRGDPQTLLEKLASDTGADAIYWNRGYTPDTIERDTALKSALRDAGHETESFNAGLLCEPWQIKTGNGEPYKVFTPFWRALQKCDIQAPFPAPDFDVEIPANTGVSLKSLKLLPRKPNWAAGWEDIWQPGEKGAARRFNQFLKQGLKGYATLRDRPDLPHVSRLSPHLRYGEISPRQLWAKTAFEMDEHPELSEDVQKFRSELAWREFSYHLLYHYPALPTENWRDTFDAYPWREDKADLKAWQKGQTGFPIVDAGLRELWQTGYMHNRVRMVVASFLIKHLRHHWSHGERWFWDTLVDADPANNAAGWQWVAGSGADAAPYFRIFNPMTQGRKFDPEGRYVRRWCPELKDLPTQHIHAPFEAPDDVLNEAGVKLGETYPHPIVDHKTAREKALAGYEDVKAAS